MSNQIDDGGPAFPRSELEGAIPIGADLRIYELRAPKDGMTLRDYFAAKAVVGIMSMVAGGRHTLDDNGCDEDSKIATLARDSYALADAMLEARKL